MCLNRRVKPFREEIIELFFKHNILDKIEYSFGIDGSSKNHPLFKNLDGNILPGNIPSNTGLEQTTFCLLVTENTIENMNKTHNIEFDSKINLRDGMITHITEKTTRAIIYGMPFILVSSPLSLQTLKEYGFKTFDKWWDESYDMELDWKDRLILIENLIVQISNWSIEKCKKVYNEMIPILTHNRMRYLEIQRKWEHTMSMETIIEVDLEKENEYYQLFDKMRFKEHKKSVL